MEIDTVKMVILLPHSKLDKARTIVQVATNQNSLTLLDLQSLTRYLNFATILTPLGTTFLRRLYYMEWYFPSRGSQCRRCLSREAQIDLRWWQNILARAPERSISQEYQERVYLWSDTASTKRLGPYYCDERDNSAQDAPRNSRDNILNIQPGSAFSISLPRCLV